MKIAITGAALAALTMAAGAAQGQDSDAPWNIPRALQAGVDICYNGKLIPASMAAEAAERGYQRLDGAALTGARPANLDAGVEIIAWRDGDGADEVTVVTYPTEIANIPHMVCEITPRTPDSAGTLAVLTRALGAPRRETFRNDQRRLSWFWQEDGRYAMADYVSNYSDTEAKLIVKASLAQ